MSWEPFIVAIIAFVGVIGSGIISYMVSRGQVAAQIKELKEEYSHLLFEKRLGAYPRLYRISGQVATRFHKNKVSPADLEPLFNDLISWDQEYAALTGPKLTQKLFFARKALYDSIHAEDNATTLDILNQALIELEFEIKRELGVFTAENFEAMSSNISLEKYEALFRKKK